MLYVSCRTCDEVIGTSFSSDVAEELTIKHLNANPTHRIVVTRHEYIRDENGIKQLVVDVVYKPEYVN